MKYAVLCPSINDVCTYTSNSEPYLLNTNLIVVTAISISTQEIYLQSDDFQACSSMER